MTGSSEFRERLAVCARTTTDSDLGQPSDSHRAAHDGKHPERREGDSHDDCCVWGAVRDCQSERCDADGGENTLKQSAHAVSVPPVEVSFRGVACETDRYVDTVYSCIRG